MAGELGDMDYLWLRDATRDIALIECRACGGDGKCVNCSGLGYDPDDMGQWCEECDGTGTCPNCDGEGEETDEGPDLEDAAP